MKFIHIFIRKCLYSPIESTLQYLRKKYSKSRDKLYVKVQLPVYLALIIKNISRIEFSCDVSYSLNKIFWPVSYSWLLELGLPRSAQRNLHPAAAIFCYWITCTENLPHPYLIVLRSLLVPTITAAYSTGKLSCSLTYSYPCHDLPMTCLLPVVSLLNMNYF